MQDRQQQKGVRWAGVWGLLVTGFTLILSGCGGGSAVERAAAAGILLVGNGPEPEALDPHLSTGISALNIQRALWEGLVTYDGESGALGPGAARSWDVAEDGLQWRFELDPQARWSDGRPVSAEDFVAAWRRVLSPSLAAPNAWMYEPIVAYRALDAGRLEIALKRPVPHLLQLLAHPIFSPIPSHALAGDVERTGPWTKVVHFIGNGPFVLAEVRPGQYIEVRANPQYRAAAAVRLNGLRFVVYDDAAAEERAFLGDQLHVTDSVPPQRVRAYLDSADPRLRTDPYLGTYYVLLNHREPVLADARIRKALALAIDKAAVVTRILGAGQQVAEGFVPRNMPGYPAVPGIGYDPERARALLAEAGYPQGVGFPELPYLYNSSESHRRIAEALQAMWQTELGIRVRLENVEWRTYLQRRQSGDFAMARAVWIGDYAEPSTFLDLWDGAAGTDWSGWADPAYGALMASARRAALNADYTAYAEAERYLVNTALPFIPLYHYVTAYLLRPEVSGWRPSLLDWVDYRQVSLD